MDFFERPAEVVGELTHCVKVLDVLAVQLKLFSSPHLDQKLIPHPKDIIRKVLLMCKAQAWNQWHQTNGPMEPMTADDFQEHIALKKAMASNTNANVPIEKLADTINYPDQVVLVTQTIPLKDVRRTLELWIDSIKSELSSLETKEAIVRVPPQGVQSLLEENPSAKVLPGKGVFTIKPPRKFKSRIVVCGNFNTGPQLDKTEIYSGGIEVTSLRTGLRVSAMLQWEVGTTDVSTAFLNAWLKLKYLILVWAPQIAADAGATEYGEIWIVRKALYGLREAPRAWGDERDRQLRPLRVATRTMMYRFKQLVTDPSMWKILATPVTVLLPKLEMRKSLVTLVDLFLGCDCRFLDYLC